MVSLNFSCSNNQYLNKFMFFLDENKALERMIQMEEIRKRQQASMDAAVAKYKEEQKVVC
jgi:hypothetical protein